MNNYHLFLIRSDGVTQLAAHLLAGILALVLFFGMSSPKASRLATAARPALAEVVMPGGTAVLAANVPRLR